MLNSQYCSAGLLSVKIWGDDENALCFENKLPELYIMLFAFKTFVSTNLGGIFHTGFSASPLAVCELVLLGCTVSYNTPSS